MSNDPEMLKLHDRQGTCPVHSELVETMGRMNKKLNLIILTLVSGGVLMLGKDALAGIIARLAGG